MSLEIHKFGGTSLQGVEPVRWAARRARAAAATGGTVVVVSAVAGVTDELYAIAALAQRGELSAARERFLAEEERHLELLTEVGSGIDHDATRRALETAFADQRALLQAAARLGEMSPHALNDFVGLGERASARVFATALRVEGVDAVPVDAHTFLVTDDGPFDARPLGEPTDRSTRAALAPILEAGRVPVVTGFLGRTREARVTTLGRSGSDYTATIVAAALGARAVYLWTDVDGIQSADPRIVPEARTLARMHYSEAELLAHLGARVLHPRTTLPVAQPGVPIYVRKSGDERRAGTEISAAVEQARPTVRAIGVLTDRVVMTVSDDVPANSGALVAALGRALGSAHVASCLCQPSPLAKLTFVVPRGSLQALRAAVEEEFEAGCMSVEEHVAQVALVGHRLADAGDVTGRAARALAEARIPRLAVVSSDASGIVSILVPAAACEGAVRTLHEEFRLQHGPREEESARGVELIVLGAGSETARWLRELESERESIATRFGLGPRLTVVADGERATVSPAGIEGALATRLAAALESADELPVGSESLEDTTLAGVVRARMERQPRRPVVVDLFRDARGSEARSIALAAGADVVVAHPEALGDRAGFERARELARRHERRLLFESALVPGLPVAEALERLRQRGTPVTFIEASLSGAVNGALSRAEEGAAFSSAWAEVLELDGFDRGACRELTGGAIVERALALGRTAGLFDGEVEITCRGLVRPEAEELDRDELHEHLLASVDANVRDRVEGCLDSGERLRFVARLEPGRLEVGPLEVPRESAIGSLHGTDVVVALHAGGHHRAPLVLRGPGASADVVSSAVLGDLIRAIDLRR